MKKLILVMTAIVLSVGAFAQTDTITTPINHGTMHNNADYNRVEGVMNTMRDTIPRNATPRMMRSDTMRKTMYDKRMRSDTMRNSMNDKRMRSDKMRPDMDKNRMSGDTMPNGMHKKHHKMGDRMNKTMDHKMGDDMDPSMDHKMMMKSGEKHVMMQNGKVILMKNGRTQTVHNYTPLSNGTKVMSDGTIIKKDGTKTMLNEGDCINRAGEMVPMPMKN